MAESIWNLNVSNEPDLRQQESTEEDDPLNKKHNEVEVYDCEMSMQCNYDKCTKNPNHTNFILEEEFIKKGPSCLPDGYKDEHCFNFIKSWATLTAKLLIRCISENRPLVHALTKQKDTIASYNGVGFTFPGTGMVVDVKRQTGEDGQLCPCLECKSGITASKEWFTLEVRTARHVVYDQIEANKTTLCLSYFTGEKETKIELSDSIYSAISLDQSALSFTTHDKRLGNRLIKALRTMYSLMDDVVPLFNKDEDKAFLPMVSYPHGCDKQVSFGFIEKCYRTVLPNGVKYNTPTCPGSSGAAILYIMDIAYYTSVYYYHHECSDTIKNNYSGGTCTLLDVLFYNNPAQRLQKVEEVVDGLKGLRLDTEKDKHAADNWLPTIDKSDNKDLQETRERCLKDSVEESLGGLERMCIDKDDVSRTEQWMEKQAEKIPDGLRRIILDTEKDLHAADNWLPTIDKSDNKDLQETRKRCLKDSAQVAAQVSNQRSQASLGAVEVAMDIMKRTFMDAEKDKHAVDNWLTTIDKSDNKDLQETRERCLKDSARVAAQVSNQRSQALLGAVNKLIDEQKRTIQDADEVALAEQLMEKTIEVAQDIMKRTFMDAEKDKHAVDNWLPTIDKSDNKDLQETRKRRLKDSARVAAQAPNQRSQALPGAVNKLINEQKRTIQDADEVAGTEQWMKNTIKEMLDGLWRVILDTEKDEHAADNWLPTIDKSDNKDLQETRERCLKDSDKVAAQVLNQRMLALHDTVKLMFNDLKSTIQDADEVAGAQQWMENAIDEMMDGFKRAFMDTDNKDLQETRERCLKDSDKVRAQVWNQTMQAVQVGVKEMLDGLKRDGLVTAEYFVVNTETAIENTLDQGVNEGLDFLTARKQAILDAADAIDSSDSDDHDNDGDEVVT